MPHSYTLYAIEVDLSCPMHETNYGCEETPLPVLQYPWVHHRRLEILNMCRV